MGPTKVVPWDPCLFGLPLRMLPVARIVLLSLRLVSVYMALANNVHHGPYLHVVIPRPRAPVLGGLWDWVITGGTVSLATSASMRTCKSREPLSMDNV